MAQAILELCPKIRRFHFQNKRFHPRIFGPVQNITVSPEKNGPTPDLVKNETAKLGKSEFWGLKGTQRKKWLRHFRAFCHKIRRFHFQNRRFRPRIFGPSQNITVSPKKNGLTPDLVKNETVKLEKSEFWGLKGTQRKNGLGNFRALPQNPKVSFPK